MNGLAKPPHHLQLDTYRNLELTSPCWGHRKQHKAAVLKERLKPELPLSAIICWTISNHQRGWEPCRDNHVRKKMGRHLLEPRVRD